MPKMRPRTEFAVMTGSMILTRVADGISTRMVTPDLSRELNPIAAGGWYALIAAAALIVALSSALHYQHLFRPVDNFPVSTGADLKAFKRHYFDPHNNPVLAAHLGARWLTFSATSCPARSSSGACC